MNAEPITITIDRRLLEHREGVHLRRIRSAIWLYLALLARLTAGKDTVEIETSALAHAMGVPEGTVRSWLGHLRKHHYVELKRVNGGYAVRVKHIPLRPTDATPERATDDGPAQAVEAPPKPTRFFTTAKLTRALGEQADRVALEAALADHADDAIRHALAKTLAVPSERIRRSRTALFLYLLRNDHASNN